MSEKEFLRVYKLGRAAAYNKNYDKAINFLDEALSINPKHIDALNQKALALINLGRIEEGYQILFKSYVIRLKKSGDIPSDINSIEAWLNGAKELRKIGNEDRALDFLLQAAVLSPIVHKEGGIGMHHTNPEIYYEMALGAFTFQKKYNRAMDLFNTAIKYDSSITIPEEIKTIYNEYTANRSGVGVKMMAPLNTSNLRDIIPLQDKILASLMVTSKVSYQTRDARKTKTYTWSSHLLVSDNGIAFQGAKPMCRLPSYYIPWEAVELAGIILISPKVADIKHTLQMYTLGDLQGLNLEAIYTKKQDELLRRTVVKLKNFESLKSLPKWKDYIEQVEYIHKKKYKDILKTLKKDRKKK